MVATFFAIKLARLKHWMHTIDQMRVQTCKGPRRRKDTEERTSNCFEHPSNPSPYNELYFGIRDTLTTKGRNTPKACGGTLARMLKIKTYQSFQSFNVSMISFFVIFVSSERAESICIRLAAYSLSCFDKNFAVLGPEGRIKRHKIAINPVREPSNQLEIFARCQITNNEQVLPAI